MCILVAIGPVEFPPGCAFGTMSKKVRGAVMADHPFEKRIYRLTLDFGVWVNDEILEPYTDEDDLDEDEKRQLDAQRALLSALLTNKAREYILEELLRKRVLEDADGAVDIYELRERFNVQNVEDEVLVEPVIEGLPEDARLFLLEAIEEGNFKDKAGEAIFSFGVELEGSSLEIVERDEDDEYR